MGALSSRWSTLCIAGLCALASCNCRAPKNVDLKSLPALDSVALRELGRNLHGQLSENQVASIRKGLGSNNWHIRSVYITFCIEARDERLLESLITLMLSDPVPGNADDAGRAIAVLRSRRATRTIYERTSGLELNDAQKIRILLAIATAYDPIWRNTVVKWSTSPDSGLRFSAYKTMAASKDRSFVPVLTAATHRATGDERHVATVALRQLLKGTESAAGTD